MFHIGEYGEAQAQDKIKMIESLNIRKNNQNSHGEHDDGDYKKEMNRNGRYMEELMYLSDTNRSKTQANTAKPRHKKK